MLVTCRRGLLGGAEKRFPFRPSRLFFPPFLVAAVSRGFHGVWPGPPPPIIALASGFFCPHLCPTKTHGFRLGATAPPPPATFFTAIHLPFYFLEGPPCSPFLFGCR